MSKISDEDLGRLLEEAAASYEVPEHGPAEILATIAEQPRKPPVPRRTWVQLSSAIAAAAAAAVFFAVNDGSPTVASHSAPSTHQLAGSFKRAPNSAGVKAGYTDATKKFATGSGAVAGTASGSSAGVADLAPAASAPVPAAVFAPSAGVVAAPGERLEAPPLSAAIGAPVNDDGAGRVVKTGSIALVVADKKVTPTITAVTNAAKSFGGYVSNGTTNEYGDTPSGEVTLRVPVAHFEDLVAQVRALDAKVRTATTTGRDVTAQYSDMEAQLKSLRATRDRFYLILAKTKTIGEILTVQQRIDGVSSQIDRLEGQRKLLASQSELATLTVSVSEADDPVVKATTKPRSGISQAFHDAVDGFVTGVESLISHSGRALLWLLCLAVIALAVRSGWRVARRRLV